MAGLLTLGIIKPHAYLSRKAGQIITRAEEAGFGIVQSKITQLRIEGAEKFYAEHKGKEFFPNLVKQMSMSPIWVFVLSKNNAVQEWRDLIGATDPAEAASGTIRHDFGESTYPINNAVHGSSTDHDAKREITFFFSRELKMAQKIYEADNGSKDIENKIEQALRKQD